MKHKWKLTEIDKWDKKRIYKCKGCGGMKMAKWMAPYTTEYVNAEDGEITNKAHKCKEIQIKLYD